MTPAQLKSLYFPAWNRAFRAVWYLDSKLIQRHQSHDDNPWADQVETAGNAIARKAHIPLSQEHLRHGAHLVAFGRDISSKSLTNKQLDKVLALFALLTDPNDISASIAWDDKSTHNRDRVLASLTHFPENYIRQISLDKFHRYDWTQLTTLQCVQLLMTVSQRWKTHAKEEAAHQSADCPF